MSSSVMSKKSKSSRGRNWCFTDFELLNFEKIYEENKDIIRYIGVGLETCPKTGKTHHQGWIQFVNQKRMGGVKKALGSKKIHLETCKGSELQNDSYCSKDNMFETYGEFKVQGQRSDLENIKKMLDNNEPMLNVANDYFSDFIRYNQGFYKYRELISKEQSKEFRKVDVNLLTGPTGCGKTRTAMEYDSNNTYKITGSSLKWFDGYEGEKILVIDEYNNDVNITTLLNLLDGYQLRLPVKGGFTYARWDKVFITTNLIRLHENAKEAHQDALYRRINHIENYW